MNKAKYIIRERERESMDTSAYFDCDTFNENGGEYGYTIFPIVDCDECYYNEDEFKAVTKEYDAISCEIDNLLSGDYSYYKNIKAVMLDYGLPYSPRNAHALRELVENEARHNCADILADYLTIKTGLKWAVKTVSGYCQGEWVDLVFCENFYEETEAEVIGEIYLGACKEFEVEELDDNGKPVDYPCGGFYVADCEIDYGKNIDKEYKRLVCAQYGMEEAEARLEIIDEVKTYETRSYRVV